MDLLRLDHHHLPVCYEVFCQSVWALEGQHYNRAQCQAWAPKTAWCAALAAQWEARLVQAWGYYAQTAAGQLAGFATLRYTGEVDWLFVAPWAQGQGVARALLAQLEQQALNEGVTAFYTWASRAARPVFERAGYQLLRPNRVLRDGVVLENDLMSKGGWQEPANFAD